jgi:dienelactone hydrolase
VLDLARAGAALQAVVSIHGDLATPMPATSGEIKAAVLAIHGAPDPVAPKAQRDAYEAEMTAAGCPWRLMVFGGVVHAFTDEGANFPGVAVYDEHAARVTFQMTFDFIKDAFDGRV